VDLGAVAQQRVQQRRVSTSEMRTEPAEQPVSQGVGINNNWICKYGGYKKAVVGGGAPQRVQR
jgi:hypothetical protein